MSKNESNASDSIKTTDISAITVNSAALEKIIGVSDRRIRQLAEENIIVRAAKGRYKLMESITNYILTLKVSMEAAESDTPGGGIDLDVEKAIHERVKRHISELKLKIMTGEVHESEDVERVMTDMLVAMKTKLLSLPAKLAPMLVSRNDMDYVRETIMREVLEALDELKEYNSKEFCGDIVNYESEDVAEGD